MAVGYSVRVQCRVCMSIYWYLLFIGRVYRRCFLWELFCCMMLACREPFSNTSKIHEALLTLYLPINIDTGVIFTSNES